MPFPIQTFAFCDGDIWLEMHLGQTISSGKRPLCGVGDCTFYYDGSTSAYDPRTTNRQDFTGAAAMVVSGTIKKIFFSPPSARPADLGPVANATLLVSCIRVSRLLLVSYNR